MLVLTPRLLYPANTGGKIRSSQLFERLARLHEITMVSFRTPEETGERVDLMRRCCAAIETVEWVDHRKGTTAFYGEVLSNLLSPDAFTIAKYDNQRMRAKLQELLARHRYDVLVCDFLHPSPNVFGLPIAPKILFQHNVESVIRQRHYQMTGNPLLRTYLYWDWRRLKRFEARAARTFDHSIMVSDRDCETMREQFGVSNVSSIPTGVDVEYFRQREPEAHGHHLVFTGSMDWFANEDGVSFFVQDVLPRIRAKLPVTFWIVGRTPSQAVRQLATDHVDVRVTGTVDDVRPYIDRAGVYVVPLRIGGGTRIKIFEAMAMSKAVVSTTIGAEGLPVTSGRDVVLADDAETLASAIIRLLESPDERARLGEAARRLVAENYTWEVAAQRFGAICDEIRSQVTTGAAAVP
jgi:sugar transferase (PEP-CTERM/EpsH1 system associated)